MKKAFYVGLILGGLLGVGVALSMDLLLGQSLGGGWADAVAKDLNRLFNADFQRNSFIVIIGVIFAIGIIGIIGAFLGGIASVMIARLFQVLTKEKS